MVEIFDRKTERGSRSHSVSKFNTIMYKRHRKVFGELNPPLYLRGGVSEFKFIHILLTYANAVVWINTHLFEISIMVNCGIFIAFVWKTFYFPYWSVINVTMHEAHYVGVHSVFALRIDYCHASCIVALSSHVGGPNTMLLTNPNITRSRQRPRSKGFWTR